MSIPHRQNPSEWGRLPPGRSTLELNIKTEPFFFPVDMYLGVYSVALNPTEIYLFSEDGSIKGHSTAGLVRFRTAISDGVDEQLLGSIPLSLLPSGTYYLYFMVTPVDSLNTCYLWATSFVVSGQTVNVPEGSAGFDGANILAPGAKILYQGELTESQATVLEEENALVGIQKDGKTYLYHPALGTAELSEENSALAMLYFIAGVTARELNSVRAAQTEKIIKEQKVLNPPGSIVLRTGFKVESDSAGSLKVTNNLRRWAAVTSDQSEKPYYFIPRSNLLPTNVIDTFIRKHAAYQGGSFYISTHTRDDIKGTRLETFGAFWRAKFFRDDLTNRSDFIKAYEQNGELISHLNKIDFKMFLVTMINSVINLTPLECSDAVANLATLGIGNALIVNELGVPGWNDSFFAFSKGPFFDSIQSLVFCAIEVAGLLTTGGIGSAIVEFFTTAWDILNALVTGVEELTVAPFEMRAALAYEDLLIGNYLCTVKFRNVPTLIRHKYLGIEEPQDIEWWRSTTFKAVGSFKNDGNLFDAPLAPEGYVRPPTSSHLKLEIDRTNMILKYFEGELANETWWTKVTGGNIKLEADPYDPSKISAIIHGTDVYNKIYSMDEKGKFNDGTETWYLSHRPDSDSELSVYIYPRK